MKTDPNSAEPQTIRRFTLAQKLIAETAGTFLLAFVDCGGAMIAALGPKMEVTPSGRAAATGLLIIGMIYTFSDISGAHFNPAVTFAFWLRGVFPARLVPIYWAAELAGALLAAGMLRAVFGNIEHIGMTLPHFGNSTALFAEVMLTFIMISVILGTAAAKPTVGKNAAMAVGGMVAMCALFARPISGASMNPARSLGPAIVGGTINVAWIYVVGPLLGATIAVLLARATHGPVKPDEHKTAAGE